MLDDKTINEPDPHAPSRAGARRLRDEGGRIRPDVVQEVAAAVEAGADETLRRLVAGLHEADLGGLIEALEPEQRPRLVELLGSDFDYTALTEVDDQIREDILDRLRPVDVAAGVRELDSDDAVYLLEGLDQEDQAEILDQLPAPERVALERSLDYPEDSAGRRMQTEFISVPPFWTVGQTIDHMREAPDLPDRFFEIYVTDPGFRLMGTVALDHLLRKKRPVVISDLMDEEPRRVRATDDQEEVARLFERYNLVAMPVVDAAERLVGVITVDDIVDVISAEADEDLKALGGVQPGEQLSNTVLETARSRFPWLFANTFTALAAAAVIGLFEGSLAQMVALAVLMPIVASMGGNAGTQTMTVAVRALATRELSRANVGRFVKREILVGLLNGVAFAAIIGVAAAAWFEVPDIGIVIGLALICNLLAAALGGIVVPLTLHRLRADPAVSSGTFVTTITDVVGFFAFLGIATLWFGLR